MRVGGNSQRWQVVKDGSKTVGKVFLAQCKYHHFFEVNTNVRGVLYLCVLKKAFVQRKMDRDRNKNEKGKVKQSSNVCLHLLD